MKQLNHELLEYVYNLRSSELYRLKFKFTPLDKDSLMNIGWVMDNSYIWHNKVIGHIDYDLNYNQTDKIFTCRYEYKEKGINGYKVCISCIDCGTWFYLSSGIVTKYWLE